MFNEAAEVFFKISNPDAIIYMLFFNACAGIGTKNVLSLIEKVLSTVPKYYCEDTRILIAVFDAYIKCGDLLNAEKVFSKMKRTVKSYGNLMNAYNKNNQSNRTLRLYEQMKIDDIQPNSFIYVLLINACANIGILSISQSIYNQISSNFLTHTYIQNALIDMWVRLLINLYCLFLFKEI